MSKPNVLFISRPDCLSPEDSALISAFRAVCGKVYVNHFTHKSQVAQMVDELKIGLVIAHTKYCTRQLPIDFLNQKKVGVAVLLDWFNQDPSEPQLLTSLDNAVVCCGAAEADWKPWMDNDHDVQLILPSFDITLPPPSKWGADGTVVVANPGGHGVSARWLDLFMDRAQINGYKVESLREDGMVDLLSMSSVFLNLHNADQMNAGVINDHSFAPIAYGMLQITDHGMIKEYLGPNVEWANSPASLMSLVDICLKSVAPQELYNAAEYVSTKHSNLVRVSKMLDHLGFFEQAKEATAAASRASTKHLWNLSCILEGQEVKDGSRSVPV